MALITKKNVSALFLLVCVDSYRNQLPAFVNSVPTIFTVDRRVLEGGAAHDFVDALRPLQDMNATQKTAPANASSPSQPHINDGIPTETCSAESSWSEGYSFLEPSEHSTSLGAFSGVADNSRIQCIPDNTEDNPFASTQKKGAIPSQLSSYMTTRDNDTECLRKKQLGST